MIYDIKHNFENNAKLLYTDTDKLILWQLLVFCNVYDIPFANKKFLGSLKDGNNGEIMLEFIGSRSNYMHLKYRVIEKKNERLKVLRGQLWME